MDQHTDATEHAPAPTTREIFMGFLGLGLTSFGGALPLARRTIVDQHRWLNAAEFTDLLGLCQFLPGGNVINLSVALGMKFRGWRGALAGILGLIAGPSLVVIALGVLYEHTQNDPHIKHLFAGLAAAAAGLLVAMAVKILMPLRHDPRAATIAALGFVAIALLRFPLLPTMLVLTPLSIFIASRVERTKAASASARHKGVSK
ncbi:chromate transporter [Paraburkholderia phymatum]|uniref:Chromate transporter n=1 Tax=Paraburkholderia phymatum (strain DSM 17167 / CIP 108236 / LMG 21445 / STM815) TaxID=391038 RepID=B2JQI9_PARP8|nr:chromate transporter [Paraburkholderia phymatum]ACC73530.1 Chromate transporter [Paraburkholderia phymatum STM815]